MGLHLSVQSDIARYAQGLGELVNQIPFASSVAINNTLFLLRERQQKALDIQIEGGPTPFTRKGFRIVKSTRKQTPVEGQFYIARNRWDYLRRIVGGSNQQRRLVPKKQYVNKYGNLPRTYTRTRRNKRNFFYGRPSPRRPFGLYERTQGRLRIHAGFRNNVRHDISYTYFEVAENVIAANFPRQMDLALRRALRTARV